MTKTSLQYRAARYRHIRAPVSRSLSRGRSRGLERADTDHQEHRTEYEASQLDVPELLGQWHVAQRLQSLTRGAFTVGADDSAVEGQRANTHDKSGPACAYESPNSTLHIKVVPSIELDNPALHPLIRALSARDRHFGALGQYLRRDRIGNGRVTRIKFSAPTGFTGL